MNILLSAQEIHNQLQKIIQYFVFDESANPRIDNILSKIPDTENVDEYAKKYENETDDFIRKISDLMQYEREDTLAEVSKASDQIFMAFTIRLFTVAEQLLNNPNKILPISSDNESLLCDCLIKYWRAYQKSGDINLLSI